MSDNNQNIKQESRPATRRPMGTPMGGPMGGMMGGGGKPKNFKASISKLMRFLKPYLLLIVVSLIFIAGASVLTILAANQIKDLTNELSFAVQGGRAINMGYIGTIGVTLIIFYATSLILNYAQSFIMAGVNQKAAKKLRTVISKKINLVPLKYYDKNTFGDVLSRVTNDVDTIGQTLNQSLSTLFQSIILLTGVLIAMFLTSWQLALTTIATVPISLLIIMVIMKFSQKYFVRQQRELGALNGQIEENYSGQSVVKAFNGQIKAQKAFDATNKKLFKSGKMSQFLSGLMMPIMGIVGNLGNIAVCVVGAILFSKGMGTYGMIIQFFVYVRLFQNPLTNLAQAMTQLQSAAAASERVFEFLEEKEQDIESPDCIKLENVQGRVEFKNVKFGYDQNKPVIHDFSATVDAGQKVAIVGPTGAGKTTIINLLMRFYELNSGEILIDGISAANMKREDVRALFGMVLQDTWLFEGTFKENIVYSKEGVTDEEIIKACEAAGIDHFIRTQPNGYEMKLSDDVNISSGQRQLLTIARAMVQNSPMLILDEATSNVDTRTEQLIQDAMDKITKGRTSFVIAHRLSTIKNADLILVLKDGDVIESGSHEKLMKEEGFYSELYNSQFALVNS